MYSFLEIRMRNTRFLLAVTALVVSAQAVSAQSMFVRAPSQYLGYGYNNYNWTTFTGMWNAKFGASNIVMGSSIGSLAGYTSLFLDANQPYSSAYNLSAAEQSTITAFLAGGGRVYGFGENDAWSSWNSDLLSLFGATAGGTGNNFGTPLVANNLTSGVNSIDTPAPGNITNFNGGVDLFSNHIAGLFDNQNAIVVLDINICDNGNINNADNMAFCQNIVNFTAGGPVSSVPEPSSMALIGTGLIGLIGVARRRREYQS